MGFSAGGGKALICPGRYPDKFTSAFATASVSSLATRYATIDTDSNPSDRPTIRTRMGNSLTHGATAGTVSYHPAGFPSENGSIENQEAYDARD
jgi:hypothetical protein